MTAVLARAELTTVRHEVARLRTQIDDNDYAAATKTAAALRGHTRSAHRFTTGPVWFVAAHVPLAGQPLQTVRGIAAASNSIADSALPTLVAARDTLDPAQLRSASGRIDVERIESVAPALRAADRTAQRATTEVQRLPRQTWLGPVDRARSDLATQLSALAKTVHSADIAARTLPDLLGAHATKHYFVVFQNDAEARGTGGLPGAFGIATATDGAVSFDRFYNDDELDHVSADVDFGPDYDELYLGAKTTSMYVNSNLGSNYPYAAQIWLSMWQQHTGQRLDGALALDPTALSYLLGVTGATTVRGAVPVTSGNVVALTQSQAYSLYPDRAQRRLFLRDVAAAVAGDIVHSHASLHALVDAAGRAAGERRLLFWSAAPDLETLIADTSVSGIVPDTSAPFAGLSIVNDGGNKLDYYLDRSVTYRPGACTGSRRISTVTVTVRNGAPTHGLPLYVRVRSDNPAGDVIPGSNKLLVSLIATNGAGMTSVTVDGAPAIAVPAREQGHPMFSVTLDINPQQTRTIVFSLSEPRTAVGDVQTIVQPLVRPLRQDLRRADC